MQGQGRECTRCGEWKEFTQFHKNSRGLAGRHSQCRDCQNKHKRDRRKTTPECPDMRRAQRLKARYQITPEQHAEMLASQGGVCAICGEVPKRPCVDHNHDTGQVRGILCHHCNIRLPAVENDAYRIPALAYLKRYEPANDNNAEETRHEARQ